MKKVFGVIGLGKFGFYVAKTLAEAGAEVIAIDKDEDKIRKISDLVTHAYLADALEEQSLEEAGILSADTVVISIGENIEASILVTMLLIGRGIKEVIAKAVSPLHGEVLKRLGVARVVYPEKEIATRLARSLLVTGVLEEIPFAPGHSIFEIKAPINLINRTLKEADLRRRYGINVLAIKRGNKVIVNPSAEEKILKGDVLLILGSEESLLTLS